MRHVIIGNGITGITAASTIRKLDKDAEIVVCTDERYNYYVRPKLIDYLAGKAELNDIYLYSQDWYRKNRIDVKLSCRAEGIDPKAGNIQLFSGEKIAFDRLILANGSSPGIPPIEGVDKRGVYTIRSFNDARMLRELCKRIKKVVVIGGGLLGLECARAFREHSLNVTVVEFFKRLLPRQLDDDGASILQKQIEAMGIEVILEAVTERILGDDTACGIRLKSQEELSADMILIAAGIRPNISLAKEAGLKVNKGVIVDDRLKTDADNIYAAGDVIEHRERIYGIIPACLEQARIAAGNAVGKEERLYEGSLPQNTLKVVGFDLTSIGVVTPEGTEYKERKFKDEEKGIYEKIVIKDNHIVGAILLGCKKRASHIVKLIKAKVDIEKEQI
ncbi:MAG: FAD-dependent oxidoreductase [Thermodesulfobacteriota bacterium]